MCVWWKYGGKGKIDSGRQREQGDGEEGGEGRKMTQHRDKQAASVEGGKKWKEKY